MSSPPKPPKQSAHQAEPPQFVDPHTGKPVTFADMRAEFERISAQTPRNPAAEHAFIESKIAMIRSDPRMTPDEKERAITDLLRASSPQ
jgi:hypothetical protein